MVVQEYTTWLGNMSVAGA